MNFHPPNHEARVTDNENRPKSDYRSSLSTNAHSEMPYKNVLLLAHDGEDFYKARIPFARYLQNRGFNVSVVLPKDKYTDLILSEGIQVEHSNLERDNTNVINLIRTVLAIRDYINRNDIDLVHSFKFIPNLINVLSNIFSKKKVVLHIAGLGIAFANNSWKYRIIRNVFRTLFFFQFIRADIVIIQNPDDFDDFFFKRSFERKVKVVKGSGVDIQKFNPINREKRDGAKSIFLCTTRLIWEKGIAEMAEAFDSLPGHIRKNVELNIIGDPDTKNPRAVSQEFIDRYRNNEVVMFLGRKENIQEYLNKADVFILPSYYREGIPRSILEALASGLPVITTTVPGCNLTVKPGKNGLLISPRSAKSIQSGVEELFAHKNSWKVMGEFSRKLAVEEFSEETVFGQILKLYYS